MAVPLPLRRCYQGSFYHLGRLVQTNARAIQIKYRLCYDQQWDKCSWRYYSKQWWVVDQRIQQEHWKTETWKLMQLQEKGNVQHPLYRLISDCRSLMRGFTSISLKHVFQEANGCAELLAKSAIGNGLGLSIFTCCPTVWSVLFHEDSEGFNTLDLLILIFMQPYSI